MGTLDIDCWKLSLFCVCVFDNLAASGKVWRFPEATGVWRREDAKLQWLCCSAHWQQTPSEHWGQRDAAGAQVHCQKKLLTFIEAMWFLSITSDMKPKIKVLFDIRFFLLCDNICASYLLCDYVIYFIFMEARKLKLQVNLLNNPSNAKSWNK